MRRLALLVLFLAGSAFADDPHHNNDGGGDITIDTNVGGPSTSVTTNNDSLALAFSHSLGDVDINEGQNCMGSEAWGSILVSRQTVELNPWCAGLFYDLNGKHELAAKMRCTLKQIADRFETEAECVTENTLGGTTPIVDEAVTQVAAIIEEREEEHDYDIAQIMQRQTELEDRLKTEAANRRAASAKYARQQQQQANEQAAETETFLQQYKEIAQQIEEPPANE